MAAQSDSGGANISPDGAERGDGDDSGAVDSCTPLGCNGRQERVLPPVADFLRPAIGR